MLSTVTNSLLSSKVSYLEEVSDRVKAALHILYFRSDIQDKETKEKLADLVRQVSTIQDGISTIKNLTELAKVV